MSKCAMDGIIPFATLSGKIAAVASGLSSAEKVDDTHYKLTFETGDSFTVETQKGADGADGADGVDGVNGVDGVDGEDGESVVVTENASNSEYVYKLDATVGDNTTTTPNLLGTRPFYGTALATTTDAIVTVENSKKNDLYINTEKSYLYLRTDYNTTTSTVVANYWKYIGCLAGTEGDSAYEVWLSIPGNEGKTKTEFIASLSASAMQVQKVWRKPLLSEEDTEINTWYYYQANGNNTFDNVVTPEYISELLPTNADIGADEYYFNVKVGESYVYPIATIPLIPTHTDMATYTYRVGYLKPMEGVTGISTYGDILVGKYDLFGNAVSMNKYTCTSASTTKPISETEFVASELETRNSEKRTAWVGATNYLPETQDWS